MGQDEFGKIEQLINSENYNMWVIRVRAALIESDYAIFIPEIASDYIMQINLTETTKYKQLQGKYIAKLQKTLNNSPLLQMQNLITPLEI